MSRSVPLRPAVRLAAATLAILCLPAAAPEAAAQEGPDASATRAEDPPELVLYADGRLLARESLRLDVPRGSGTVTWTDAPDRLDPASLSLTFSGPRPPEVLETVHRPPATGAGAALDGLAGRGITVRTRGGTVHRGRLISASGGVLTLRTGEGTDAGVVVVPEDRVESYRLPGLPPGFRTRPAVVWTLRAEEGGRRRAEVAYLADGTGWDAEYVARLAPAADRMSFTGRAVLRNGTDRTWERAAVKLVAGEVGREEEGARPQVMAARAAEAGDVSVERRAVGDFHVYELPRPVTLEAGATVRTPLLRAAAVDVRRLYWAESGTPGRWPPPRPMTSPGFGPDREEEHVAVVLALANREAAGLGRPLPAGRIRVYRRDEDGGLLLAGADRIGDTPAGDSLHLRTGRAFDVVRERTVTAFRRPTARSMEEDVRVVLRNAKEETVTVRVVEQLARWTEWEVVDPRIDGASSVPRRLDAGRVLWSVPVPAGGSAELTYTARYRWAPQDER